MIFLWNILLCYLLVVNLVAFALYGLDKNRAKQQKWRIRERTLLLVAFLGGGIGAYAGMLVFRHKTQHVQFRLLVPLSIVLWAVAVAFASRWL
jgi:uncharacterized membrane protein YsdA (DUF1294 family)